LDAYRHQYFDGSSTVSEDMTTNKASAHFTSGSFGTEFAK
jgi:hypothetical protein